MPQKKNPDVAEIVRGKVGRVYGDLTALLTLMKGLPMAYNRDLQEDKAPVFDASDTLQMCLAVVARMIPSIAVHEDAMFRATQRGFLEATDLADFLTEKGMPFREAHGIVGGIVLRCTKQGKRLADLTVNELKDFSELFDGDALRLMDPEAIIGRRNTVGGTAPKRVRQALRSAGIRAARRRLAPKR